MHHFEHSGYLRNSSPRIDQYSKKQRETQRKTQRKTQRESQQTKTGNRSAFREVAGYLFTAGTLGAMTAATDMLSTT
jgi:hypothetical protein